MKILSTVNVTWHYSLSCAPVESQPARIGEEGTLDSRSDCFCWFGRPSADNFWPFAVALISQMDLLTMVDDWRWGVEELIGKEARWLEVRSDMRGEEPIAPQAWWTMEAADFTYVYLLAGHPPILCVVFISSLWLQSCDPKGNCLSAYNKGQRWDWELHSSELIVRDNAHHWRMKLADVYISLSL